MDPKSMDGPVVKYTVNDLFKNNPKLFITYHAMTTPLVLFNTVGVVVGGGLYGLGLRPYSSALSMMGTTGSIAGCGGMLLGLAALTSIAQNGEAASPPWNDDCVQMRVDGLSHNFKVRVWDVSLWSGMGLATGALLLAGGPAKLKLSGGTLGVVQALSLGSAVGSLGALVSIYSTLPTKDEDD